MRELTKANLLPYIKSLTQQAAAKDLKGITDSRRITPIIQNGKKADLYKRFDTIGCEKKNNSY